MHGLDIIIIILKNSEQAGRECADALNSGEHARCVRIFHNHIAEAERIDPFNGEPDNRRYSLRIAMGDAFGRGFDNVRDFNTINSGGK